MKLILRGIALILVSSAALCTQAAELFVSPAGQSVPPYASWSDAATTIQDAIDAASAGDVVWVTNGFYATGGKVTAGDLTNRVALDKAVTVQSVNGPLVTVIQGAWDPATNGPLAIRCAWVTNGALLQGFTLQGGATRTVGTGVANGGGVFCTSTGATVANCLILSNAAASGGGAYQATLNNCLIITSIRPLVPQHQLVM